MSGLRLPSLSKAALVAFASLMLSLSATASYADNPGQIAIAREGAHVTTPYSARALYRDRAFVPNQARSSNECVGGYRWTQREVDSNLTPGQLALPIPCR